MIKITDKQKEFIANKKLSYSSLKEFKKSPMHYVQYCLKKPEPTPAMILGSLLDCLMLTPSKYKDRFIIMPEFPKKVLKTDPTISEQKETWLETNKDKTIITETQKYSADMMVEALMTNEVTAPYFEADGVIQHEIFWKDKETGLQFKGFLDKRCDDFNIDIKKIQDASEQGFARAAIKYDYPLQAAMYQYGTHRLYGDKPFTFVCAEPMEPYATNVFHAINEFIEYGYNEYIRLVKQFEYCKKNDLWHQGYEFYSPMGYYNLGLPGYIKAQL